MSDTTPGPITEPSGSPRGEPCGRSIQCWCEVYQCDRHDYTDRAWPPVGWCYDSRRRVSWIELVGTGELSIQLEGEPLYALNPAEWAHVEDCPKCGGCGEVPPFDPMPPFPPIDPPIQCDDCNGEGVRPVGAGR